MPWSASETWTLTVADSNSLDAFHMKWQRRILGIGVKNVPGKIKNVKKRKKTWQE